MPVIFHSHLDAVKARAESADVDVQFNLGVVCANGSGVAENDQEAIKLFQLEAKQGLADAQEHMDTV